MTSKFLLIEPVGNESWCTGAIIIIKANSDENIEIEKALDRFEEKFYLING